MSQDIVSCEFGQSGDSIDRKLFSIISEETDHLVDTTGPDADDEGRAPAVNGITEKDAQEYIIKVLVQKNGFIRGREKNDTNYKSNPINPRTGLDITQLTKFIKETQPAVWDYFAERYSEPEKELEELVKTEKETRGTLAG